VINNRTGFQMKLDNDIRDFIVLLNKYDIEYLLIGGYAVIYYKVQRYTRDIDFLIRPAKSNAEKMLLVMQEFGMGSLGLTTGDFLDELIIQIGFEPNRIDILKSASGIDFVESYKNREIAVLEDGTQINIISKQDLIKSKLAAGRDKDKYDVSELE